METHIEKQADNLRKSQPHPAELGFGRYFTDHMMVVDWQAERGWYDARIVPYGPFALEPAAAVFHYGQEIFEGLKAFRQQDDRIGIFRPETHWARLNRSAARVALPQIDAHLFIDGLTELIRLDKEWLPSAENTALYIRPAMIATETTLGVKAARQCRFFIILSPVGAYSGHSGKLLVEEHHVRAAPGGTGAAKTGGNYAASLVAAQAAAERGFDQVLWLDGTEHRFIEEAGAMNIFFITEQGLLTPKLSGTFLAGVTRDSLLHLATAQGLKVEERSISIEEVITGLKNGWIREIFTTGTAAGVWPISRLCWRDESFSIGDGAMGQTTTRLRDALIGIQYGRLVDPFGWMQIIDHAAP